MIIFGMVNLLAAMLSGAAGGGGSLISGVPLLILLGLNPAQAVATTRFGGFGISLGASTRFFKEKITDKRTLLLFSAITVVCALIGSVGLLHLKDQAELLQRVMGVIMLLIGIPSLYTRRLGLEHRNTPKWMKLVGMVLLVIATILLAAFSAGLGSLQLMILLYFFGMTAIVASATRRFMNLVGATVSLAVYIPSGLVNYPLAITALITSMIGGFAGAHLAIKKGDKFIINLFAVISAVMALELIFGQVSK